MITKRRDFPAVEELLQAKELQQPIAAVPRPIAAAIVKQVIADSKAELQKTSKPIARNVLIAAVRKSIAGGHAPEPVTSTDTPAI